MAAMEPLHKKRKVEYVKGGDTALPEYQDWVYMDVCDSQILVPPEGALIEPEEVGEEERKNDKSLEYEKKEPEEA